MNARFERDAIEDRAAVLARKSGMTHNHACFIVDRRGRVVAEACNKRVDWMTHGWSVHAEVAALQAAASKLPKQSLAKCSMYVFRMCSHGGARMSQPCEACKAAIQAHRLRCVYFST
jgi:tRNA(Arg) A34 adenosine deaminase TadA